MSESWTPERILALAPDSSSASEGRGLAAKKNWGSLGKTDSAIWGECQGSGKNPYQRNRRNGFKRRVLGENQCTDSEDRGQCCEQD